MKKLVLVLVVVIMQGCAFSDAELKVQHSKDKIFNGPIKDLEQHSFVIAQLEDKRSDTDRIGWKKNGYGQNTADITTDLPVDKIVSNGVMAGLEKTGHLVGQSGDVLIKGSVNRFWFEFDPNFWNVEFTGDVQCTLDFVDATTNEAIYTSDYSGTYSKKSGGGLEKTWTEVMSKAVDNLIENIIFDEDLVEALEDR